jgi:hypothetical protein
VAEAGDAWAFPISPDPGQPVVSASGQVLISTDASGPTTGTELQAVTPTGSSAWSLPSTGDEASNPPIYDQGGVAYWEDPNDLTDALNIVASRNGSQLWSVGLGFPASSLMLGANGLLYFIEETPTPDAVTQDTLIGLQRSDGSVIVHQDLKDLGIPVRTGFGLYSYSTGIVLVDSDSINFLSYTGQLLTSAPPPTGFTINPFNDGNISVSLAGDVFLSFGPGCDGDTTAGYLARIAPDGSEWEVIAIPSGTGAACRLGQVTALPDGGVVYAGSGSDPGGNGVSVYNADGTLRWHDDGLFTVPSGGPPGFDQVFPPTSWHVDSAGHLIGFSECSIFTNGQEANFFGSIAIFVMDSSTGAMLDQSVITAANDPSPRELEGIYLISDQNRAYVTGQTPNISGGDPQLWAVDISGLAGDWPSTAIRGLAGGASGTGPSYVALGDSYSSGEGVAPYFEPKNSCHRSMEAYPTQIDVPFTAQPFEGATQFGWGFLACSGATTSQIMQKQLTAKRDKTNTNWLPLSSSTSLVTITAGGDDVDFGGVLTFCFKKGNNCESDPYGGYSTLDTWATAQFAALEPHLAALYKQIRLQAPNAQILVLGYPQLLPASSAEQSCFKLQPGFPKYPGLGTDEQSFIRSADDTLNTTIDNAVTDANIGATFLPVAKAFTGHEVCGSSGEWINGPSITLTRHIIPITPRTTSFHPNQLGQDEYATIINSFLDGH